MPAHMGEKMIDSVIIGYNLYDVNELSRKVELMGRNSGAFKDLNVNTVSFGGKTYQALDALNHFINEGRETPLSPFHVFDLFNPAIAYLGTYLDRAGFTFDYVNMFVYEKEKARRILSDNEVLTVAITTTNYVSPEPINEIVRFIRKYNDRAKIILGGPYINYQRKTEEVDVVTAQFNYLDGDIYVMSEMGEQAYVDVLQALKGGKKLSDVANIAYKENGQWVFTKKETEYKVAVADPSGERVHEIQEELSKLLYSDAA